jgi:hypothetical protein
MHLALKESQLGLRNSTTRLPFRYGVASLIRCPQAMLRVVIECEGQARQGFSGDCLPPSWFDKSPNKGFAEQVDDMLRVIGLAQKVFSDAFARETAFFPAWFSCHEQLQQQCVSWGLPRLLASFGSSLVERAIVDAACRRYHISFARAMRDNLLDIDPGLVERDLDGTTPSDWLPAEPVRSIFVRHTVGLGDALTVEDILPGEELGDGWPQALEEYVTRRGVRYFKVKVANRLEEDLDRLRRLARVLQRHHGRDYRLTLDGNEQYKHPEAFVVFVGRIRGDGELETLWDNVLAIEQPFDRAIALTPLCTSALHELSRSKPVIIDESDDTLDAYPRAIQAGYRGVSSKNCKGAIKSLLNAGLTWLANDRGRRHEFTMTGEDLCTVGIVPLQADLCLAATLGLAHVERNGHHYHPGLSYLPDTERRAALSAHRDLYTADHAIIGPKITDGRFDIGSLQCPGFGFAVEPDMSLMAPPETWTFDSLGL